MRWPLLLLFLTFCIITIYIAVLKRHAGFILFFGTILLLFGILMGGGLWSGNLIVVITVCLFWITGILFIIWSIILFRDRSLPENTFIKDRKKYKYLLYSATIFCLAGMLFGMWGREAYQADLSEYYQFPQNTYFPIMGCLLVISILQFVIYYILCKRVPGKENQSPEERQELK